MPVLKFRNFLAASRKPNMLAFGMYRAEAAADIVVIENNSGADLLGLAGTQDGSNATFTTSAAVGKLFLNGALLAPNIDYSTTGTGFILMRAPIATDIILAFGA